MVAGGIGPLSQPTPEPGRVEVYELFKDSETGMFSRNQLWSSKMPMDYNRINARFGDKYCETKLDNETQETNRRRHCATGGGPLVVADFDGDNKPDIGLATRWSYVVYKNDGDILWADFNTQDDSSAVTGSSVFDFEGDGVSEVLYADEIHLHIYKGLGSDEIDASSGLRKPLHLIDPPPKNSSGTADEYPLVVDVDNDGHSEIVVVSNDYHYSGYTGIRVFEDPEHWVRTRRIWNQFDYHVTNINEDGTVPKVAKSNWLVKSLNNYRQNVQPDGMFNAPNLVALDLEFDINHCPAHVKLIANIENKGSLGIRAGLSVKFYAKNANNSGKDGYLGEAILNEPLLPGAKAKVNFEWDAKSVVIDNATVTLSPPAEFYFVVDEQTSERPMGYFHECIEDDNESISQNAQFCPAN